MREEFEKLAAVGKIRSQDVGPLVELSSNGFCMHRSWGFGRVTTVDAVLGRLTIDFPGKSAHSMDMEFAAQALHPISKNHILARKATDLNGLRQLAALNHLDLIQVVLESFDGKATQDQIQKVLVPDVIADDYRKWWDVARREMKKDGHYIIPTKKTDPITRQTQQVPLQHSLLQSVREAKGLKARLKAVHELNKAAGDLDDQGAVATETLQLLNQEISTHVRTQPSLALEAIFSRDELHKASGIPAAGPETDARAVWALHPSLGDLLAEMPLPKQRQALESYRAHVEDWHLGILGILNKISSRLCGDCVQYLVSTGHLNELKEVIGRLVNQHQAEGELLIWLTKERSSDVFADILGPEVLRAILTAIERDSFNEKKSSRVRDHLVADIGLIHDLTESADIDVVKDLTRALQLSPSFDGMDKRSLLGRIVKSHPSVQSLISGEARQDNTLTVSWDSLQRRQKEYETLVRQKVPENSKEIAIARSYGDLRENHEYKAAKEMQKILLRRKAELESDLNRARGTDFAGVTNDAVGIGTKVHVTDATGTSEIFTVLGAWDSDPDKGVISYLTPVAQALLGHKVGEQVELNQGEKPRKIRIELIEVVNPNVANGQPAPVTVSA